MTSAKEAAMFTLQQINTVDDGANGVDATAGGDGGDAPFTSEAFNNDDSLGSLETGGLLLVPQVVGGAGGGALAGQPGAPGGEDITSETIDGAAIVTTTWGPGGDGEDGGAGGAGGGASLILANDQLEPSSAYYNGFFELTLDATGGGGAEGTNGGGGGDAGYTDVFEGTPVEGNTYYSYVGSQGGAGGDGGGGGAGGSSDDTLSGLQANATGEVLLTLNSFGGAGGTGGFGGDGGGGATGGVGGSGGDGGDGGAAAASLTGSTVVSPDAIFATLSATGGGGGAGETGGGGGEGNDQGEVSVAASGLAGSGGAGDLADDLIDNDSFTASAIQIQTEVRGGAGGVAFDGAAPGSAGPQSIAIEDSNFTVTSGEFNQLALDISEQNGSGAYVALDGASGGNLVFSGNDFAGTGASTLYLGVQGGGVVVDAINDLISIGGSPENTMTGFTTFHLDDDDTILLAPGDTAYVADDADTVVITAGRIGGTIVGAAAGNFVLEFSGFSGLTLQQLQNDTTISNGNTIISLNGGTVTLDGYTGGLSSSNVEGVSCFCAGTRIATQSGDVPVEHLAIGDAVMTASGKVSPISWIGRRKVATRLADPLHVLPIRIKAGAVADRVPSRDLLLSPDHAILFDNVLVQAGALVNGTSIVRETNVPETFTYYHVELDGHSLILAESTPAETFIDNVDRLSFDNWQEHETLYPDGKPIVEMSYPRAKSNRQVPRFIRERIAARNETLGLKAPVAA
jgi:Hint domain